MQNFSTLWMHPSGEEFRSHTNSRHWLLFLQQRGPAARLQVSLCSTVSKHNQRLVYLSSKFYFISFNQHLSKLSNTRFLLKLFLFIDTFTWSKMVKLPLHYFSSLLLYDNLEAGVLGLRSWIGFFGLGCSVDWVWGLWCGAFWFFGGLGSLYKRKILTLGTEKLCQFPRLNEKETYNYRISDNLPGLMPSYHMSTQLQLYEY